MTDEVYITFFECFNLLEDLSFPDFSRRFSVSLTTIVDTFVESSLKVFTLSSFPS